MVYFFTDMDLSETDKTEIADKTEVIMSEGGFLVFMGVLLLLVIIAVVIAVVSAVSGAAAAIADDDDEEE